MNLDLDALQKTAEEKIDAADQLLRILPEDPLDLRRRLAVDNHSILGIRAMRGWFPVCDCVSAGDLPVIWFDTVHCGTLICSRREFLDALQALLLLARNDPRSFVEGFGRDVLNRIEDWSSRFYRWIDSDGVQI